jgi:hypothetical protein
MGLYGSDLYALTTYGPPDGVLFSSYSMTARSKNFGSIEINWTSPFGEWSRIKLTRNSYGFPIDPWDGAELDISKDGTYFAFKETDPVNFIDNTNIGLNTFYYYSLFVFDNDSEKWIRSGDVIALSSGNYNYTNLLYEYLPNVYKINSLGDPFIDTDNEDLYNFLSLFGFQLNLSHTYTNLIVNRYSTEKVGGTLIPTFMQQFGLSFEPEIGLQQSRILLQNSVLINKERGTGEGLVEFIKSYAGYEVGGTSTAPNPHVTGLTVGPNLMLDYNDSSFEESNGHWTSPNSSASLYCLKQYKVTNLALTSNVATLTIGAHNYQVSQKVYTSGFSAPLFNSGASTVTITAITGTTISFALTGTNVPSTTAYNNSTDSYPLISPYPTPWNQTTTPVGYPNKQKGVLAVRNASVSSGTVAFSCGASNAITKGIPVTAGLAYSFSIYTSANGTTRTITVGIDWYNRFGVYLSSSTGTGTANVAGQLSTRLQSINKTAPTGAYYAVPTVSIASSAGSASNEWHYFDAAQFEQSATATNFDEARQVRVVATATNINELINPHFAGTTSAAPWVTTGGTDVVVENQIEPTATLYSANYLTLGAGVATLESTRTSDLVPGDVIYVTGVSGITNGVYTVLTWEPASLSYSSYITFNTGGSTTAARTAVTGSFYKASTSLEVTASGSSVVVNSWDGSTVAQQMGIYYPDTEYTFSAYVKSSNASNTATPSITWYTSSNVVISTSTGATVTITAAPGSASWVRPFVTAVAPSTAAYATVKVTFATASTNTLLLDSALFENKAFASPFFSGAGGSAESSSFIWEGTANASRSHYYKNYAVLSNRLSNGALTDQVPLGGTVAVYYAQPKT